MKKLLQYSGFMLVAMIIGNQKLSAQFANLTNTACYDLIQANVNNPNFAILDVRTAGEYNPTHIEGAINYDYYAGDFYTMIGLLPKNKTYIVHCASGGRSANTYNQMQTMGFTEVYNMLGGMGGWNSASLPSTSAFAPLQMLVSDSIITPDTIYIGETDTIVVTVTNRANDTLEFYSVTDLSGTEFSHNFDINTTLLGPFDYSFNIYYQPWDDVPDSIGFTIESNGGSRTVYINRTGKYSPAAELSLLSDTIMDFGVVDIGQQDTLYFELMNSGYTDLDFTLATDLTGTEFTSLFNVDTAIMAGSSYAFAIIYAPVNEISDDQVYTISSVVGDINIYLSGIGNDLSGIRNIKGKHLNIYPNPANEFFYIEQWDNNYSVTILDVSGKTVKYGTSENHGIDISGLERGVYLVRIMNEADTYIERIIIN